MEKEIVFFSPWRGFTELVKRTAREVKAESIDVVEICRTECDQVVRQLEIEDRKVIVAKEYWVQHIEAIKTKIFTYPIHVSTLDLTKNIISVSRKFKRIGYICSNKEARHYDFSWLDKTLNVKVTPFLYKSDFDIGSQVNNLLKHDIEYVLTTGPCIAKLCRDIGIPAHVVCPGKETVVETIERVMEMLAFYNKGRNDTKHFYTIFNSLPQGLLVLENNTITIMNDKAGEFLNWPLNNVIGRNICDLNYLPHINRVFGDRNCIENKYIELNGHKIMVNQKTMRGIKNNESLLITLEKTKYKANTQPYQQYYNRTNKIFNFNDIIGNSNAILDVISQAKSYAQSESTILIAGESGTGKELFAQSIHNYSLRKEGPFVAVNCAALPETLLDSELFGYEKGAFTGADRSGKPGLFELANGGTIFLDEITELPLSLQPKLLRVLQEREIRRIGGKTTIPVNARVIASINKDIKKEVAKGNFRLDLYYRIDVLRLAIPPLRERKEDISVLFNYFLQKKASKSGVPAPEPDSTIMTELEKYKWPGNVRELTNFVERYLLCRDNEAVRKLCNKFFNDGTNLHINHVQEFSDFPLKYLKIRLGTLEEMENQIIEQLIYKYRIRKNDLIKILGVSRSTLWRKNKNKNL
jgi:transcriptional regulator with PAS, ATPase and Fis domain